MTDSSPTRMLAAILSTDVVDYSRLMSEDDEATIELLKSRRALIKGRVRDHAGRIVDSVGDNLLAEFRSTVDAVASAIDIQETLAEENQKLPARRRMDFRIGIHLGEIIAETDGIYGDGVNVAARLESSAPTGGISLSGAVFEQVRDRPGLEFEDRGERSFKNFARPIRVYGVKIATNGPSETRPEIQPVPGFAGQAAIAVLAFQSRGEEPDHNYLGEGIAEELITRLSRQRRLPVIAPGSSFAYQQHPADLRRVGAELGARYVVEGRVSRRAGMVRVRVRLGDTSSTRQLWAERYDRSVAEVLDLEDEISLAIASAIQPALADAELQRARHAGDVDPDAWETVLRAEWHLRRMEPEHSHQARVLYERATEQDPGIAAAWSGLAIAHLVGGLRGWTPSATDSLVAADQAARQAMKADPFDPEAQHVLGTLHTHRGERRAAIAAFERALELDPSHVHSYTSLGQVLAMDGRPQEAIPMIERAMRLSPRDPLRAEFLADLAVARFVAGDDEEAVAGFEESRALRELSPGNWALLCAAYALAGRERSAKRALEEMRGRFPSFSWRLAEQVSRRLLPSQADRILEGLRRAGLDS